MRSFVIKKEIRSGDVRAVDFLSEKSGLSKTKVKDAMNKGAVWLIRKGHVKRLRRAKAVLKKGDRIEFYYSEKILSQIPQNIRCLKDLIHYSVWFKPAGMLSQGTKYGDHLSLLRQVELFYESKREVYPVHRLDREVAGVMMVAHTEEAASALSELFKKRMITKEYRAQVKGNILKYAKKGKIDMPIDGKEAVTEFETIFYDPATDTSMVRIVTHTGRLHQIRKHMDMIGYPVIGDPRYGKDNKNRTGIRLIATSLKFHCPFQGRDVEFSIDKELR